MLDLFVLNAHPALLPVEKPVRAPPFALFTCSTHRRLTVCLLALLDKVF